MRCLMIVLSVFLNAAMHAGVELQVDDEQVCPYLQTERKKTALVRDGWQLFKDAMTMKVRPKKVGYPAIQEVMVAGDSWVRAPASNSSYRGSSIIFSLGIDGFEGQKQKMLDHRDRFQELEISIAEQQKILAKLMKPFVIANRFSVARCEAKRQKYKFSWKSYIEQTAERNTLVYGQQFKEDSESRKILDSLLPRLHLKWDVVRGADIDVVYKFLKSRRVENMIIITHGRPGGEILDSDRSIYPPNFFRRISPSVRSIALFSCHSAEAAQHYALANELAVQPSYYSRRLLFTVKPNELYGKKDIAPLSTLKHFIKGVDGRLSAHRDPAFTHIDRLTLNRDTYRESCVIRTKEFHVTKGTIGAFVNRTFVGAFAYGHHNPTITFDCDLLKKGSRNFLSFENLRYKGTSAEEDGQFSVVIDTPTQSAKITKQRHFAEAGDYQKSVFSFILED